MTNEANPESTPAAPTEMGPDDPRYGYAMVTAALHPLIAGSLEKLDEPTPCAEFIVKDLLEHLVMVQRRAAAIGRGEHWSSVDQEAQDSGWGESFQAAAHATMEAWTDSAKLGQTYEVPWGEFPGAPVLFTYTAELAVHSWDLAHATGQDLSLDDAALEGALFAAKMIPAEGRGPEMPFDPVVEAPTGAPVVDQMAGWMGRQVA